MAKKINALEQKRLAHINHLMAEVHAATNNVYESFVDKEYDLAKFNQTFKRRYTIPRR